MDPPRINEIVVGKRSVTANTALRLGRYFKTSPQFWMGLQAQYELDVEGVEEWKGGRLEDLFFRVAGNKSCLDNLLAGQTGGTTVQLSPKQVDQVEG